MFHSGGDLEKGLFKVDYFENGYREINYGDGSVFKGHFEEGTFNGEGEYACMDGLKYNGNYKDGNKDGLG